MANGFPKFATKFASDCECDDLVHSGADSNRFTTAIQRTSDRLRALSEDVVVGEYMSQESAKGAGGKGARVINCHNFFFTPDRETRRIDHTTTEGTAERKMRQFATPAPFRPFSSLFLSKNKENHKNLDGPIRANRLTLSRIVSGFLNSEPLFCESRFRGLKIANRRFEAIRAHRSHVMKLEVFLRIDSRKSL